MMRDKLRRDLIESHIGDELLIYDPLAQKAHCLNPPAAKAFLALQAGQLDKSEVGAAEALELFAASGFFEAQPAVAATDVMSRRNALAIMGKAAAALPLIISVVVPTPAAAQSGIVTEAECRAGNGCGLMCDNEGTFGTRRCGASGEPLPPGQEGECGCFAIVNDDNPSCECTPISTPNGAVGLGRGL